jgi:hypothetical protein
MNINPPNISPTDDIRDVMDEIRDWGEWAIEELEKLKYPSPNIGAVEVFIVILLLILALILNVVTGGAVGS